MIAMNRKGRKGNTKDMNHLSTVPGLKITLFIYPSITWPGTSENGYLFQFAAMIQKSGRHTGTIA
jgi:hypothetical protein